MHHEGKYSDHLRSLFRLGAPLVAGQVAHMSIGVTDSVMLGWHSVEALASGVLGHTFFFVLFIVGAGFGAAVMPVVASALAQNDPVQARRVTRMGLWLSSGYAIAVLPLFWWSEPVLLAMGQSPELSSLASGYLRTTGFAIFPALILGVLKSYLSAQELMRFFLLTMIGGFLLNIPLNYILIFGNFGFPELGVQGAAIASLCVNSFMALCAWVYTAYKLPKQALFARLWRPDWNELVKVMRIGVPIAVTSLAEAGLFSTSSIMMGWLGTVPLAAHGIVLSITSLTFVFHLGLSGAATIQAGQAFGKGDFVAMGQGALSACLASLGFVIVTVVLFLTLPEALVSLFVDPNSANYPQILAYGVVLLAISALFSAVDAAQVMALGLLRGLQDTSVPMAMAVFSYWIIGIPVGYWLCFVMDWGGVGLWAGLAIGLACAAFTLITRFILLMKRMRFAANKMRSA